MSLQNRIQVNPFQENAGVSAVKINSVKKNVFGTSKKTNALADVKNTVYLKTNTASESTKKQLNSSAKKIERGLAFEKENPNKEQCITKPKSEPIEPNEVIFDVDIDDCSHCLKDDPDDLVPPWQWPEHLRFTESVMNKICLDPNPKSSHVPLSPRFDIDDFNKEEILLLSPPRMNTFDDLPPYSSLLIRSFEDIPPVYDSD